MKTFMEILQHQRTGDAMAGSPCIFGYLVKISSDLVISLTSKSNRTHQNIQNHGHWSILAANMYETIGIQGAW